MISKEKNFLFIHIPKTGGNSIQNVLIKYSDDKVTTNADHQDGLERFDLKNDIYSFKKHSILTEYKKELDANFFESLFKFTVVRNPWDRLISYYFSPHRNKKKFNRNEFKEIIWNTPILRHYTSEISFFDKVFSKFNIYREKEKSLDKYVDYFIRFENLESDFKKVCDILNISHESLPVRNKSDKKHYSYYYDDELIDFVEKKFQEEIDYFNYKFERI